MLLSKVECGRLYTLHQKIKMTRFRSFCFLLSQFVLIVIFTLYLRAFRVSAGYVNADNAYGLPLWTHPKSCR